MGACGCGDFSGDLTFPAPDGDMYVLDLYHGCEDCDASAGVVLYRFTREEAGRWGIEKDRKPLDVPKDGIGIPVLDANVLRRLVAKEVNAGLAEYISDAIADGMRAHFRDASWKTYSGWKKERERHAKRGGGAPR